MSFNDRPWFLSVAQRCSAFLFFMLLTVSLPALAASPITGVTVSPATGGIHSGAAVYLRATVEGTGDFDHRVNWSLSPGNAGTVSPTGLYISDPGFTGTATIKATSVENPNFSGAANIYVSAGSGGLVHVDLNNGTGVEDGSAFHPYRAIQVALNHGEIIKVAQGTYTESIHLPWQNGALILGGFKGGSAADYAANKPGDFVTRSTDHLTQVTTIQSPDRSTLPAVTLSNFGMTTHLTYAVDGFTLRGGSHGLDLGGSGPIDFFISENLITGNGVLSTSVDDMGGGIKSSGLNIMVLNNRVADNLSGRGGGIYLAGGSNSLLVQENIIANNRSGVEVGGGGFIGQLNQGQRPGLFTWNVVRGNTTAGYGGGIGAGGGPLELSHNVYADNEATDAAGGIHFQDATIAALYHELIYKNCIDSYYSGAGIHMLPNSAIIMDHCTLTENVNAAEGSTGGLYVREQATALVRNSIIWGNSGDQIHAATGATLTMTYSDSQTYAGAGNISVDPLFADPAGDDYHLKSRKGRWNPAASRWVWDPVHSPGIDAGDPAAAFDQEPIPNGSRTNMGVYGYTPEASKSLQDPMCAGVLLILEN